MKCIAGNELMLRQLDDLLGRLDEDIYANPLELFHGSSIGQHIRHILNFYQAVLSGTALGVVDYANRDRDMRLERDPRFAGDLIREIATALGQLDEGCQVLIRTDFLPEENGSRPLVPSSVGRELMFVFDHAVHHLAIVKMGLRAARPDMKIPEELGLAPSTIKYKKSRHTAS